MEHLNEHIEELIADKISGQIKPEDDLLLEQLILSDEAVRMKWEESLALVSFYKAEKKALRINDDEAWTQLLEKMDVKPEVLKLPSSKWKWFAAASVLMPIILFGLWFGLSKSHIQFAQNKSKKSEQIKVTLSDGTVHTIDSEEGLTAGEIHFGAKSANQISGESKNPLATEMVTLHIPKGKTYAIVLNDGTSIKINSASILKFPLVFNGNKREVELDGEAFFEVVKNGKPFIVKTQEMDVKVLGTKFNVNTYPGNSAQTSLIEGSVSVSNFSHPKAILIKPGEAVVKRDHRTLSVEHFSADKVLSWLDGTYYFSNMPLREIVNITNRVTGEDLYITDSKIANYRFSGALETDKPINVLLENIKSSSSSIQYAIKDGRIELY